MTVSEFLEELKRNGITKDRFDSTYITYVMEAPYVMDEHPVSINSMNICVRPDEAAIYLKTKTGE